MKASQRESLSDDRPVPVPVPVPVMGQRCWAATGDQRPVTSNWLSMGDGRSLVGEEPPRTPAKAAHKP